MNRGLFGGLHWNEGYVPNLSIWRSHPVLWARCVIRWPRGQLIICVKRWNARPVIAVERIRFGDLL